MRERQEQDCHVLPVGRFAFVTPGGDIFQQNDRSGLKGLRFAGIEFEHDAFGERDE